MIIISEEKSFAEVFHFIKTSDPNDYFYENYPYSLQYFHIMYNEKSLSLLFNLYLNKDRDEIEI